MIARARCEARLPRTQAFAAAGLHPGRRACGASAPPESCLLEREPLINARGETCALRVRRSRRSIEQVF
jgi:hypothetical protein